MHPASAALPKGKHSLDQDMADADAASPKRR